MSMVEPHEAVRGRRELLGLTVKEACERSSLSHPTWECLERLGARVPRASTLVAASRTLRWPDTALHRILAGEDPASIPDAAATIREAPGPFASAVELLRFMDELPGPLRISIVDHVRQLHAAQVSERHVPLEDPQVGRKPTSA